MANSRDLEVDTKEVGASDFISSWLYRSCGEVFKLTPDTLRISSSSRSSSFGTSEGISLLLWWVETTPTPSTYDELDFLCCTRKRYIGAVDVITGIVDIAIGRCIGMKTKRV